ncbi:hypothetical protein [Nonomuraea salmonea]|uniref:hypothetical protein n=1 Tax=Nonomuraea salmonea TaxID=46181 RepID=UPI002FE903F6
MRITTTATAHYVDSGHYRLTVSRTDASAELEGWLSVNLLASVNTRGGRDETYETLPPVLAERDGVAVFDFPQRTTEWQSKTVRLTCTPETIAVEVRVEGDGVLSDVTLLGGRAVLNTRAAGTFRSGVHARGVFSPTPAHPVNVVRPVSAPVALTVVGDASPGGCTRSSRRRRWCWPSARTRPPGRPRCRTGRGWARPYAPGSPA